MMQGSGIYCIRNTVNNRVYVGSTKNFEKRKKQHFQDLDRDKHCNPHLQNAYKKYGKDKFTFEILEIIFDLTALLIKEQLWIEHYEKQSLPTYNIVLDPISFKTEERITRPSSINVLYLWDEDNKCFVKNTQKEEYEKKIKERRKRNKQRKYVNSQVK